MKTNEPGNHDEPLRKVLREWRTDAPLPPRFEEQVWRCIDRAQAPSAPSVWAIIVHGIGTVLPRPAPAVSYVAVLLVIGVTVGWAQAHQETVRVKNELGQRYVRVLDPYLAPRN